MMGLRELRLLFWYFLGETGTVFDLCSSCGLWAGFVGFWLTCWIHVPDASSRAGFFFTQMLLLIFSELSGWIL
jgi:hypothetical protein